MVSMTNYPDTPPDAGPGSGPTGILSATAGTATVMAVVVDVLAVLLFALIGTLFHSEDGIAVGAWLSASWPFLLGLAVAWALLLTRTVRLAPGSGLGILIITWLVGVIVRSIVTLSVAWGFVLTSLLFLTILMLGWRIVASLVTHRR